MGSNESMMLLLGYCFRMFLISVGGQCLGLCMTATMLKVRDKIQPLMIWLIIKYIIQICIVQIFLGHLQGNQWYEITNFLLGVFCQIITTFMFYLTFHGTLTKCFMALVASEVMVSIVVLPAVMIVNYFQGREELFLFALPFQISDLLIVVLAGFFFLLFYHCSKNILIKYRNYQFKHPIIWLIAYIIYNGFTQVMTILDITDKNVFYITMYGMYLFASAAGALILIFMYLKYTKSIQLERAYLNSQLGLLETHYQAIQSQVHQMESCQQIIAQQMEEITSEKGAGLSSENTQKYLDNLKQEYNKIRAGMYCDDWRIDAVLYCQIEAARAQGIEVDCQVRGYDKKIVNQQVFAQVLFLLLHNGIRLLQEECKPGKMQLRTGFVNEKFVISFSITGEKIEKAVGRQIHKLVKTNGGMFSKETDDNTSFAVITFG